MAMACKDEVKVVITFKSRLRNGKGFLLVSNKVAVDMVLKTMFIFV